MDSTLAQPRHDRAPTAIAFGLAALLAVGVGAAILAKDGNLGWDDADYLRRGLELARRTSAGGPVAAIDGWLREGPKPPWLVGWIAAWALVLGRSTLDPLLITTTALPFGMLAVATAIVARRLGGSLAGVLAVLALAVSPCLLALGGKVMVETFLGLWVLLAIVAASALLARPTRGRAALLGAAIGLAALTKLTVVLLLAVPLIAVAVWLARPGDDSRTRRRALTIAAIVALALAGPWYARNARPAVEFGAFSARHNLVTGAAVTPRSQRPWALAREVAGPVGLLALAIAGVGLARRGATPISDEARSFLALAGLGAGSAAIVLIGPSYFDPRFLAPTWPVAAVAVGIGLARLAESLQRPRAIVSVAGLLLAAGVGWSGSRMIAEPSWPTAWGAGELIDELVAGHGVRHLGNVGNGPGWNVCKTGLINELRDDPAACFVLHDLSRADDRELAGRLGRFDAVVVLDPWAHPPGWLASSPGLNSAYPRIGPALTAAGFVPIAPRTAGLPPLTVFVRR